MRPRLAPSLAVAHRVLRLINLPDAVVKEDRATVVGYENGREHGLALRLHAAFPGSTICWAENRNSDEIVVYVGALGEQFSMNTNVPTDRAYAKRVYFPVGAHARAAAFISTSVRRLFAEARKERA